jgi:hypothetical protein
MTAGRTAASAAGLVGLAGLLALGACRITPPAAEPPPAVQETLAIVPATLASVSARTPARVPGTERRGSVPPGILSRAAEARALERVQACPPAPPAAPPAVPPAAPPGPACVPEPHATVEIEWDGARGE